MAPTMTPLDLAVSVADKLPDSTGGTELLARACGVSRQFFNRMRREYRETGAPPRALRDHAPLIESALGGRVTVEHLYPEVRWIRNEAGAVTGYCVSISGEGCTRLQPAEQGAA